MSYYFLGQKFEPGKVLNYVTRQIYNTIIGIDIGHGESVIYLYYKDGSNQWQMNRMKMDKDGNLTIPTYIRYTYTNSKNRKSPVVTIGHEAKIEPGFSASFKQPPDNWYNVASPADIHGHTCDELLEDYIRVLIADTKKQNTNFAAAIGQADTLLVVGCPASEDWTKQESTDKYRSLLSRAAGHPTDHIAILPESTAAIMSEVYGGQVDFANGVLVCDNGSFTSDITYIYLGEVLYTASLEFGGSDIEEGMLKKAVKDCNIPFIPPDQRPVILAGLRRDKEDFYRGGGVDRPAMISVRDISTDPYINYTFTIDMDFMDDVLKNHAIIHCNDPAYNGKSWAVCCDTFFKNTSDYIKLHMGKVPFGTLVLTGGTSNVTQLQTSFRAHYGAFRMANNTSDSVAIGLCYAKRCETEAAGKLKSVQDALKQYHDKYYRTDFLPTMANVLAKEETDIIKAAIAPLLQDPHLDRNLLQQKADNALKNNAAAIDLAFQDAFETHNRHRCTKIMEDVNALSAEVYQGQLQGNAAIQLNVAQVPTNMNHAPNLRRLFRGGLLTRPFRLIKKILTIKDPNREKKEAQKIILGYNDQGKYMELRKKRSKVLLKDLKNNTDLRNVYDQMNEEQFEVALGKVLLLVTDKVI